MNEKNPELEKTETLATPQSNTVSIAKKEQKSIIPKMVLVALTSFVVSFVVAFMMSNNLHESQRDALKAKNYEDPKLKQYIAELEANKVGGEIWLKKAKKNMEMLIIERQNGYIDDLGVWTKDIAVNMPASEASKAFGKAGLAALEDGTITDKEYNDLSNQHNELVKINKATDLEKNLNSPTK